LVAITGWLRSPNARLPLAIILFGVATISLLWIGIFYWAERQEQAALDQMRRDTTNLAIAFREQVLRTITAIDQAMLVIKTEYALDPDHFHLPDWINHSPALSGITVQIGIIGPDGRARLSNLGPADNHVDLSDRAHFRYHLSPTAPQPYISAPVVGRVSGKQSIQITRRLERADGAFAGVLVVSLDPFYLSHFFDTVELGSQGVVLLFGRDGIVRARQTRAQNAGGDNIVGGRLLEELSKADQGALRARSPIDGIDRIKSFAALPGYPLAVMVGLGVDEGMALAKEDLRLHVLQGVVVSLVIAGLVTLLLRQVAQRLGREETVARQAALLSTILDVSPVAFWVKGADGRLEMINDVARQILNRGNADTIGRRAADLLPASVTKDVTRWDDDALNHPGGTAGGEITLDVNGERRSFLTFRRACDVGDRTLIVGAGVDITPLRDAEGALRAEMAQREEAEARLRQAQKMESIGRLTGGIAHDFNNMLTAIAGNLERVLLREQDPEKIRHLKNIEQTASHGARLVHHLLAFARKQHLEPQPVNINRLVEDFVGILQSTCGSKVRIDVEPGRDLWLAMVDANQVETAILNIALNARDAMPMGGRICIESANVPYDAPQRPRELDPGEFVSITMRDTGTGMTEEVLAKAFDPFFTTKEFGRGSGLGLSQVHGIAKQSGGTVEIESIPGQGTTVRIYLPKASIQRLDQSRHIEASGHRPQGSAAILVVDDDPLIREFVTASLVDSGYSVSEAADGYAALRTLEEEAVDVAVIDLAMPEMQGIEVARRARLSRRDLPILFITGYADPELVGAVGDDPLLMKPFRAATLRAEVASILIRARGMAARAEA
jgi:signal transduction histidine kinase/CheY-like chemotaxis protein